MPLQILRAGVNYMSNIRVLKIQPEYRMRKYARKFHTVPSLKLSGEWLANAGFLPGKIINVLVKDNCLVIAAAENIDKL